MQIWTKRVHRTISKGAWGIPKLANLVSVPSPDVSSGVFGPVLTARVSKPGGPDAESLQIPQTEIAIDAYPVEDPEPVGDILYGPSGYERSRFCNACGGITVLPATPYLFARPLHY